MAKKRKWGPGIAFLFSIVLFSISLFSLMGMIFQKLETEQLQAELMEIYQEPGMDQLPVESDPAANRPDAPGAEVSPGLLALHESNPDCIGWLTIEGTVINYPVMYRPGGEGLLSSPGFLWKLFGGWEPVLVRSM